MPILPLQHLPRAVLFEFFPAREVDREEEGGFGGGGGEVVLDLVEIDEGLVEGGGPVETSLER
jgi:hypothetical protein